MRLNVLAGLVAEVNPLIPYCRLHCLHRARGRRTGRRRTIAACIGDGLLGYRRVFRLDAPFSSLDVGRVVRVVGVRRVVPGLFQLDQQVPDLSTRPERTRRQERRGLLRQQQLE
jgi:hypothetical protein